MLKKTVSLIFACAFLIACSFSAFAGTAVAETATEQQQAAQVLNYLEQNYDLVQIDPSADTSKFIQIDSMDDLYKLENVIDTLNKISSGVLKTTIVSDGSNEYSTTTFAARSGQETLTWSDQFWLYQVLLSRNTTCVFTWSPDFNNRIQIDTMEINNYITGVGGIFCSYNDNYSYYNNFSSTVSYVPGGIERHASWITHTSGNAIINVVVGNYLAGVPIPFGWDAYFNYYHTQLT